MDYNSLCIDMSCNDADAGDDALQLLAARLQTAVRRAQEKGCSLEEVRGEGISVQLSLTFSIRPHRGFTIRSLI